MKFIKGAKDLPTDRHVIARYFGNVGYAIRLRDRVAFRHTEGTTTWRINDADLDQFEWLDQSESEAQSKYDELKLKYDNILATADSHSSQTENVWQSGYAAGHDAGYERGKREAQAGAAWIKATDRLPEDENLYHLNYGTSKTKMKTTGFYDGEKWHRQDGALLDWHPNLEWLDKSGTAASTNNQESNGATIVNAEYLCTFASFDQWVNKASSWIGGHRKGTVICVDNAGNLCLIGEDFMAARDFKLFPVKAYRMKKTIEAV